MLAFARQTENQWALVFIPLNVVSLTEPEVFPLGSAGWKNTTVTLPENCPKTWKNIFTDQTLELTGTVALADIFAAFPVALLIAENL